jgi:aminoglycoside phosphotransferase (APT) family kinase protein
MGNILVDAGKIVAIIDWELAGYYPWWVEVHMSYFRALATPADELFDAV